MDIYTFRSRVEEIEVVSIKALFAKEDYKAACNKGIKANSPAGVDFVKPVITIRNKDGSKKKTFALKNKTLGDRLPGHRQQIIAGMVLKCAFSRHINMDDSRFRGILREKTLQILRKVNQKIRATSKTKKFTKKADTISKTMDQKKACEELKAVMKKYRQTLDTRLIMTSWKEVQTESMIRKIISE